MTQVGDKFPTWAACRSRPLVMCTGQVAASCHKIRWILVVQEGVARRRRRWMVASSGMDSGWASGTNRPPGRSTAAGWDGLIAVEDAECMVGARSALAVTTVTWG